MTPRPETRAGTTRTLPPLHVDSGTLEALKWLGFILMALDHVDKYLLHERIPALFAAGRLAMPIFSFVLAYNLARPGSLEIGVYRRVAVRLAIAGVASSIPFVGLGGLAWGWWPLNIMFTLLLSTGCLALLERDGRLRQTAAVALFLAGGAVIEFWWPAPIMTWAVWRYARRPSVAPIVAWAVAATALYGVNRNFWALAALPLFYAATQLSIAAPRLRHAFYVLYPLHLCVLWLLQAADG